MDGKGEIFPEGSLHSGGFGFLYMKWLRASGSPVVLKRPRGRSSAGVYAGTPLGRPSLISALRIWPGMIGGWGESPAGGCLLVELAQKGRPAKRGWARWFDMAACGMRSRTGRSVPIRQTKPGCAHRCVKARAGASRSLFLEARRAAGAPPWGSPEDGAGMGRKTLKKNVGDPASAGRRRSLRPAEGPGEHVPIRRGGGMLFRRGRTIPCDDGGCLHRRGTPADTDWFSRLFFAVQLVTGRRLWYDI